MSRLPFVTEDRFTPEQAAMFESITGGARARDRDVTGSFTNASGGLRGPFNAWLTHPTVGDLAQRLAEALRYRGALSGSAREIAILMVAARWRAQYEWWAHERLARREGLADDVIAAIKTRETPVLDDPLLAAVHRFSAALLDLGRVPDDVYADAREHLDDPTLVELVALLGHYTTVSLVLNAFEIELPDGEHDPFETHGRVGPS